MNLKLTIFAFLSSALFSCAETELYVDRYAELGEALHQVSIEEKVFTLPVPRHHCAGSAVDKSWILTTGFCIWEMQKYESRIQDFQVVAGRLSLRLSNDSEQIRSIHAVYKHQKYPLRAIEKISLYDIGLIKLDEPLELNEWVQLIALPKKREKPGRTAQVAGWRFIRNRPLDLLDSLKIQTLDILNRETCNSSVPRNQFAAFIEKGTFPDDFIICAGPKFTDHPVCVGDTGGALIKKTKFPRKKKIIGILSYVIRIFSENEEGPSIYTKVSKFLPWIKTIMTIH